MITAAQKIVRQVHLGKNTVHQHKIHLSQPIKTHVTSILTGPPTKQKFLSKEFSGSNILSNIQFLPTADCFKQQQKHNTSLPLHKPQTRALESSDFHFFFPPCKGEDDISPALPLSLLYVAWCLSI